MYSGWLVYSNRLNSRWLVYSYVVKAVNLHLNKYKTTCMDRVIYSELCRVCMEEEVRARLRLGATQLSSLDLGARKINWTD